MRHTLRGNRGRTAGATSLAPRIGVDTGFTALAFDADRAIMWLVAPLAGHTR
jgi:hypothetical protein